MPAPGVGGGVRSLSVEVETRGIKEDPKEVGSSAKLLATHPFLAGAAEVKYCRTAGLSDLAKES